MPLDTPAVPNTQLPFPLAYEEVKAAIFRAGNTSPGVDEIPPAILREAWPLIQDHIIALFTSCLSLGYHPICFRQAEVVILQKLGKTDLSSP